MDVDDENEGNYDDKDILDRFPHQNKIKNAKSFEAF